MPVSTRSQMSVGREQAAASVVDRRARVLQPTEVPPPEAPSQEQTQQRRVLRDPHHGLKEKMKALTLLYEQHKKQLASRKDFSDRLQPPSPQPTVHLFDSGRKNQEEQENAEPAMKENILLPGSPPKMAPTAALGAPLAPKNAIGFPRMEPKEENQGAKERARMTVYSCPKKSTIPPPATVVTTTTVARKLSLGGLSACVQSDGRFGTIRSGSGRDYAMAVPANEAEASNNNRIMVFVRLRPMNKKEKDGGSRSCVKIMNKKEIYLTEFAMETDYLRLKRVRGRHFCFDASFPDSTTQQEVYATTTSDLVEGVLQGRNGSVFCYGATGAGKTYTMLGTVENPGVMVLAIKDLFSKIRQRSYDGTHSVQLSYLEVYNETVRDLLSPGRPLVLREDKQGIVAAGLTQYRAYTTDEVMALLQQGNQNRTTEPTRVNETSSRSHAILQVVAEYRFNDSGNIVHRVGKLSLIDLAGSERALATDQRTQRSIEGANINRSLLALSSCINALVEGKKHIPYRNSKLTQLLKDSLGGPCNTVMIANISPSNLSFGETQNTLHWADRAKEIKTKACIVNEEPIHALSSEADQAKLVLELQKENSQLRQQLMRQQQKLLTIQAQSLAASPAHSKDPSPLRTPCSNQNKPKRSILSGKCLNTPDLKSRATRDDAVVKELRNMVKALEADMAKLKKEHELQLKHKDDFIRELITKYGMKPLDGEEKEKRIVTRASLRKGGSRATTDTAGELRSPSNRFQSPAPAAKKRSFWDITNSNSPSVHAVNGRKTRSHIAAETPAAPSMLLQLACQCFWFVSFMLGPHVATHFLTARFCSAATC